MNDKTLIVDLDDTIFRTKSMDAKVLAPFFDSITVKLASLYDQETIQLIVNDLWMTTWDKVIAHYAIPLALMTESFELLGNSEDQLDISPYPDYRFLQDLPYPKYLVTTSLTSLQESKIKALRIERDFTKIIINDPFKETRTKLDIFKELVAEYGLVPKKTYVVGDNADAEIKAGNTLGMVTIQIVREGVVKGNNANYCITTFQELERILHL